ncbi:hypothetical protein [Brevibacillus laterosporus]
MSKEGLESQAKALREIIASIFLNRWILLLLPFFLIINIVIQPFLFKGKLEKLRKVLYIVNVVVVAYSSIMLIYFIYNLKFI